MGRGLVASFVEVFGLLEASEYKWFLHGVIENLLEFCNNICYTDISSSER